MSREHLVELLATIDAIPRDATQRALIDEAVSLAVEISDEEMEYEARLRLTESAEFSGDTDAALTSFAWCLAKYDSDPARFLETGSAGSLLWRYKWVIDNLSKSPVFSRSEIDAAIEDMRLHYQRAGFGMSAVLTAQFKDAWTSGRLEEADALRVRLEATPRDDHSDCEACVLSESAGFLAEVGGREAEALSLIDDMTARGLRCEQEPEAALGRALLPLLRTGRLEDAKSAHLRGYRMARHNPNNLFMVADHLVFCAVTGNEARGLTLVERHLGWLTHDGLNESGQFHYLLAQAALLDAVARIGHGDVPIRAAAGIDLSEVFGDHREEWTVATLRAASWDGAARIGSAFDARNGNDHRSDLMDRARASSEESYDVPILTDTFTAAPPVQRDPSDAIDWYERALEYSALGDAELAVSAVRRALADHHEEGDRLHGAEEIVAHAMLLGELVRLEDWEAAASALPGRIAALRAHDYHVQAGLEERIGLAMFGRMEDADRLALEDELAACSPETPNEVRGRLQVALASANVKLEEPRTEMISTLLDEAVNNLDCPDSREAMISALSFQSRFEAMVGNDEGARRSVARLAELAPDAATWAKALTLRASLNAGIGEFEAGADDADEATRLFVAMDARPQVVYTSQLAGALLGDAGHHAEAVSRLRFAVTQAERMEAVSSGLSHLYGCALVRAGLGAEASDVLSQAYDDLTGEGAPPVSRAETLYWLGHAFLLDGQYNEALGAWVSAVDLFSEDEHHRGAALAGSAAGSLLARFEAYDDSLALLDAAAVHARKNPEDVETLAGVLHSLGQAQANAGSVDALITLQEGLALAIRMGAAWLIADVTNSKARALGTLGRTEEALPVFLSAADDYVAAGDSTSAAVAELAAARLLVQASRESDAVAIYRGGLDHAADVHPDLTSILAIELGDVLERLGRTDEATQARALAQRPI